MRRAITAADRHLGVVEHLADGQVVKALAARGIGRVAITNMAPRVAAAGRAAGTA